MRHTAQACTFSDSRRDVDTDNRFLRSLNTTQIPTVSGDVSDPEQILTVLERYGPDVVIGAVDRIPTAPASPGWFAGCEVNYQAARATVDACTALAPEQRPFLLWVGSQDEYGLVPGPWHEKLNAEPTSPYATSKLMATDLLTAAIRTGTVTGCVVRLPLMFGEGQADSMLIPRFIITALHGLPLPIDDGDPVFMLGYMPDAAEWMIRLVSAHDAVTFPQIINTPGYRPATMHELVRLLDALLPDQIVADPRYDASLDNRAPWPDTTLAERISMGQVLETPIDLALAQTVEWYDRNRWFWLPGPRVSQPRASSVTCDTG